MTEKFEASECTQPFTPECDVYKVIGKIYLMSFELKGISILNLKVDPTHDDMLHDLYPYIRTGYHMNKRHWISVHEDTDMDIGLVEDLIFGSYELVVSKLTKTEKLKIEILKTINPNKFTEF